MINAKLNGFIQQLSFASLHLLPQLSDAQYPSSLIDLQNMSPLDINFLSENLKLNDWPKARISSILSRLISKTTIWLHNILALTVNSQI